MSRKNFGQLTVLTHQMRALLLSVGCNSFRFSAMFDLICKFNSINDSIFFCTGAGICSITHLLLQFMRCVLKNQLQL